MEILIQICFAPYLGNGIVNKMEIKLENGDQNGKFTSK